MAPGLTPGARSTHLNRTRCLTLKERRGRTPFAAEGAQQGSPRESDPTPDLHPTNPDSGNLGCAWV